MLSLIIPVYRNEGSIPELIDTIEGLNRTLSGRLEAVFVDDGSPDRSLELLQRVLPAAGFHARLVVLSRNFGSFSAIRAGLAAGRGDRFAVMAADLQEPPSLIEAFNVVLAADECDVVVGSRNARSDPLFTRFGSWVFWRVYRMLAQREIPKGGVDVFACNRRFRDEILALQEQNTTLVGLVFWLGFRRREIGYVRQPRRHGTSAWSLRRRVRYLLDSSFAFSYLPIRVLSLAGALGIGLALVLGAVVLATKFAGNVQVPGYTATVLTVMFFGGLNSLGIGMLGEYVWRTFENTKGRPTFIVARQVTYGESRGSDA
jgi:polyisoprenyl-phosphate glycosyltransferase